MMGVIAENLRHAARSLAQSPGFTASTVLMLGLAIGAVSGVFSVVNAVLLEPWPYREPQRLVQVLGSAPGSQFPAQFGVAPEFFVHWRERSTLIESLSTTNSFTNTARLGERAERLRMSSPTQSLFETLGSQAISSTLSQKSACRVARKSMQSPASSRVAPSTISMT